MTARSARGLFRALKGLGPAPRPAPLLDGEGVQAVAGGRPREALDFYPTPAEATRAFLAAEIWRLREFPMIWEPAAGDGAMVRDMRALGFAVYASDVVDRGCGAELASFYAFDEAPAAALVTNPPYRECGWRDGRGRWVRHALERLALPYVALLLNLNWPCVAGLAPLLRKHPISRVYVLRWKLDFTREGAPPNQHAWFVWDCRHRGETVLRFLDRADARQGELFTGA